MAAGGGYGVRESRGERCMDREFGWDCHVRPDGDAPVPIYVGKECDRDMFLLRSAACGDGKKIWTF